MHNPLLEDTNYDLERRLEERFESVSEPELCEFSINYILHCSKCPRLSAHQNFFKVCVNNHCFQLPQNVTRTDEITRVIRHKRGEIGPPCLLSEHCDPPFLFHFWSITTILNKWTKFETNLVLGSILGGMTLNSSCM